MTEWLKREYREEDMGPLLYLLGVSYTRSRAGGRAGAYRAGGSREEPTDRPSVPDYETQAKQRAFMEAMRPVWAWLLSNADVTVAVDPEAPSILWGWCITSPENVVHAVGCKRSFTERTPGVPPLSAELVTDLLGDRLKCHQVCSLELPQMRLKGSGAIGIERPREWSLDPTWLVTRMGTR